ncbi:MAG: O-antigen/teichoic acid export membrane protein [Chitinophagales bacterium]|jgi:O-antigen/teichoic acid export membrane protein
MMQRILQSTFIKLSSIVFLGNLFSQILIFVAYALFARYFDKVEIGIYTVFISLSILLAVPSTGRYELAAMLPKKLKDSSGLLKLAVGLSFLFSLVLFVLLYLIPFQSFVPRLDKISSLILLLPLGVFFMASFQSFIIFHNKLGNFKLNALFKTIQAAVMLIMSFVFTQYWGFTAISLVLAWVMSQAVLFVCYGSIELIKRDSHSLQELKVLGTTYKRYPTVSMLSNFVNTFSVELPNYFIPMFWGAGVQTLYAYGARVAAMPRNFIGSAIGEVFFNTSSKLAAEQPEDLLAHLKKVSRSLMAFSVVIYLLGIVTAKFLFPLVFGADYIEAVPYFQWMAAASIFLFVQSPISVISDVINRLDAPLVFNLFSIVLKVSALVIAGYLFDSPVHMIMLYAITTAGLSLFWIIYLQHLTKKETHKAIS